MSAQPTTRRFTGIVSPLTCRSILLLALLAFAASAAEFTGKVVGVTDGDTLAVLDGTAQRKVRLLGIDAPEKGQAFGREVRVVWKARDR